MSTTTQVILLLLLYLAAGVYTLWIATLMTRWTLDNWSLPTESSRMKMRMEIVLLDLLAVVCIYIPWLLIPGSV